MYVILSLCTLLIIGNFSLTFIPNVLLGQTNQTNQTELEINKTLAEISLMRHQLEKETSPLTIF